MKLDSDSKIGLQTLVGALVSNSFGGEYRITSFCVSVSDLTEVYVNIQNVLNTNNNVSKKWAELSDWTIQLIDNERKTND